MSQGLRTKLGLAFLGVLAIYWRADHVQAVGMETASTSQRTHIAVATPTGYIDGKPFLDSLCKTAAGFEDYSYDSVFTLHNSKGEQGAGSFFFKRVSLLRVQVKTSGPRDGTVVVRQADGKIRLGGGHMFKFLKMTVAPDSRLLLLPNGYNVVKSDLVGLLDGVKSDVSAGSKSRVTPNPIMVDRLKRQAEVFEVVKSGSTPQLTDRIFIDPATNVPIAWDVFREGNLFSTVTFDNFRANMGLNDDLFKL
jgi:outer membrane lipoprotein-sorting protein